MKLKSRYYDVLRFNMKIVAYIFLRSSLMSNNSLSTLKSALGRLVFSRLLDMLIAAINCSMIGLVGPLVRERVA